MKLAVQSLAALTLAGHLSASHASDPMPGSLHTTPFPGFALGVGLIPNLGIGPSGAFQGDEATASSLQSDGKILLAGSCSNGSKVVFCLARLDADGNLDTSFVGPDSTGTAGKFLLPVSTGWDRAYAVAPQANGNIIVAGTCFDGSRRVFCAVRLNVDGTLDSSVSAPGGFRNGKLLLPMGNGDADARAVAVQSDGKIVLVGSCGAGVIYDFCIARLNVNGTLDVSFGETTVAGTGQLFFPIGPRDHLAQAVALQSDGKIVLAGGCQGDAGHRFCLARINPDGSFDTQFVGPAGTGAGKFLLPGITQGQRLGSTEIAFALALQPDGKIVVAGYSHSLNYRFGLVRLNSDGELDSGFVGPDATGTGTFEVSFDVFTDAIAYAAAMQPDGKIIVTGRCENIVTGQTDFCIARLNDDGGLDTNFGGPQGSGNGKFVLPMGSNGPSAAAALAVQQDGRIVVAGTCFNGGDIDFCAARLNGGPYGAQTCTLDVDGDGKVSAISDTLIATRVALGITGAAVTNGVPFSANATRRTWTDIRNFLVSQCNMMIAQ